MTPIMLQKALCEEIRRMFENECFYGAGGKRLPLSVFEQDLPRLRANEDEDAQHPYAIVALEQGQIDAADAAHQITIVVAFSVCSDSWEDGGQADIMHLVFGLYDRFACAPFLGAFALRHPLQWWLAQEDTRPYYFGAVRLQFDAPAFRVESPFV